MKWFRNLKISVKLISTFLVIALIAGGVGVYGIITMSNVNVENESLFLNYGNSQGYLGYVLGDFNNQRALYRDIIMLADNTQTQGYVEKIKTSSDNMTENLKKYKNTCLTAENQEDYIAVETAINKYISVKDTIVTYVQKGDYEGANNFMRESVNAQVVSDAQTSIDNAITHNVKAAEEALNAQKASTDQSRLIMIILVITAVIFAVGIGIFLSSIIAKPMVHLAEAANKIAMGDTNVAKSSFHQKDEVGAMFESVRAILDAVHKLTIDTEMLTESAIQGDLSVRADASQHQGEYRKIVEGMNGTLYAIIKPVKEAIDVMQEMSKGNLDVGIDSEYSGDFIMMKESINEMVASLNSTMMDINGAADQVSSGARQVSDGVQETSQGATEQASSIEELTSSVTQIAAQTKQNAMSANKANELTASAKNAAAQGNEQMKAMQRAMGEISEASQNINKIIKVIDDIAFQTNILALNAAVEAARAGVHGKGFAVVAEEVRNLAARSASAAKETTDLIEGSIKKTEAGTKIADETAKALLNIVSGIEDAAQLVGEIADACSEQASAISQINSGIEQMSQVVQANSATAEEGAAAAEELSGQAELLKGMVSRFNLKGNVTSKPQAAVFEKKAAPVKASARTPVINMNDSNFGKY